MDTRLEEQQAFVEKNGWGNADLFPLPADASSRTYTRLTMGEKTCLLMDAPPTSENLKAYLDVNRYLASIGLRVPEIYAEDTTAGMALIENFGEDTFTKLLESGVEEAELYDLAVDVLVHAQKQGKPQTLKLPPYDMPTLMREVNLFTEWFVPYARGRAVTPEEQQLWESAWQDALTEVAQDQSVFVFRDFHVDNAMRLQGEGVLACGLLDFQDALVGSPVYDLVSLIEDARREVSPDTRRSVVTKYFSAFPELDLPTFLNEIGTLGAQRHAKVAGIFIRLSERDDKHGYLKHMPHVLKLLDRSLSQPHLMGVQAVVHELVPNMQELEFPVPQTSLVPPFCAE